MNFFFSYVERQFGHKIKCIRSDQGAKLYAKNGIKHEITCIETPQQNGRVERKYQHILKVARALKLHANLLAKYWSKCVLHIVFLINCVLTPILSNKSPYSILFGTNPNLASLRVFGCLCYASTKETNRGKFDVRQESVCCLVFL